MSPEEKAATGKAARDLAAELNDQIEGLKRKPATLTEAERKRRSERAKLRRRKQRNGTLEPPRKCGGTNMKGKPCQLPVLVKENWDGDEEVTGLYCLHHEPNITRDQRESFRAFGTSRKPVYRKVTPGEIAHELIQRSPQYFLRPYLQVLGLKLDENGDVVQIGTGLKLHGYSRGGQVIRSKYPDYVGQVNVAEKLMDRIYGKARQSVDLASMNTTVSVSIVMDVDRVDKVSETLIKAGVFPNGNGNGNGHRDVIDTTAHELLEEN